ncbi:hypothetical protein Tcan_16562 [Toxocara canis]|uniref:Uncharacterized protein n=1 Tax=Toxocara canis TaxID=6265 RepID=A0A0B2VIM5_TOXCA|nr:hypothetical protein Tcan_16562 [Toxocara canis]
MFTAQWIKVFVLIERATRANLRLGFWLLQQFGSTCHLLRSLLKAFISSWLALVRNKTFAVVSNGIVARRAIYWNSARLLWSNVFCSFTGLHPRCLHGHRSEILPFAANHSSAHHYTNAANSRGNYNFHNERKAIAEYEKERAARSARANEEPVCSKATPASITPDTALRKVRSEGILEPSPAPINNNPLVSHLLLTTAIPNWE